MAMAAAPEGSSAGNTLGWRDRAVLWRDRLLTSETFQRLATAFPPTRPIVRRRVRSLFDLCAGFVYSQVLYACVKLRLFEEVAAAPATVDELAQRFDMPADGMRRLVDAAISLDLLERRSGSRIGLGALGAAMVNNAGIKAMVEHHALLYADLADPLALLRGTSQSRQLQDYWGYAAAGQPDGLAEDAVASYSALMAASQAFIASEVIAAYPFARHRRLLDVGGGEGAFLQAVALAAPRLQLGLFDLPAVAERARARLKEAGVDAEVNGGDFFRDGLPAGADLVSLVRVLHDHDDDDVLTLLRAIRASIAEDGVLLIAEPMAETRGAEPIGAAYFGFYLCAMGSGRARSPSELGELLVAAGFDEGRMWRTRTPLLVRILVARPAASRLDGM